MILRSQIGLDVNDPVDKKFMEGANIPADSTYFNCVSESCYVNIENPPGEEEMTNSTVTQRLQAGIPRWEQPMNTFHQSKSLLITTKIQ